MGEVGQVAGRKAETMQRVATSRPVLILASLAIGLWSLLSAAEVDPTAPVVHEVRLGVDAAGQTRIVFDMDERPAFTVTPAAVGSGRLTVVIDGGR